MGEWGSVGLLAQFPAPLKDAQFPAPLEDAQFPAPLEGAQSLRPWNARRACGPEGRPGPALAKDSHSPVIKRNRRFLSSL